MKVNYRDTRIKCEICSKITVKTPERPHWHCSGVFTVNFEYAILGCEDASKICKHKGRW